MGRTDERKISPYYRTSSPTEAAAQKGKFKNPIGGPSTIHMSFKILLHIGQAIWAAEVGAIDFPSSYIFILPGNTINPFTVLLKFKRRVVAKVKS